MEFRVSRVKQGASGGSSVVKYSAEVEVRPGTGRVEIELVSTFPDDPDHESLSHTIEFIRRGAVSVLQPRGLDGVLRLHPLVIHDVDCRPNLFEIATAEELTRLLETK